MKEVKRIVSTNFWLDDLVADNFTPEERYLMLYLMTNPHTTQLGIYHLPIKQAALQTGYSVETVVAILGDLQNKYDIIKFSSDTNEVAIKNYLRHSVISGGKPVYDCLLREVSEVKDKSLILYIINNIYKYINNNNINTTVLEFIEYINNKYNDNDNDNERFVNDSSNTLQSEIELCKKVLNESKSKARHKHGQYQHVLLTDTDYNKLVDKFGSDDADGLIQYLDEAIEMKGYKYKNHYLVIAKEGSWVREQYFKTKTPRNETESRWD